MSDLDALLPWETLDERTLNETRVLRLRLRRARSRRSGAVGDFTVLEASDWVNVIALTEDGEVVLVEQYRHGTQAITLEIPGGMVDPGEDALAAGARELQEETGYTPAAPGRLLGEVEPNPALQGNRCGTVFFPRVRPGPARPDPHEELRVRTVPARALPALVRQGEIRHALVVAALGHAWLRGLLPLDPGPAAR